MGGMGLQSMKASLMVTVSILPELKAELATGRPIRSNPLTLTFTIVRKSHISEMATGTTQEDLVACRLGGVKGLNFKN